MSNQDSSAHQYLEAMMKNLANMNAFTDVIFVAGKDNQQFRAHRAIAAASSNYLNRLLRLRGLELRITITEIDGETLKNVLGFIYSGRSDINDKNVFQVMTAASSMELGALEKLCAKFAKENMSLTTGNCVAILLAADKHELKELATKAESFILENFESIQKSDLQRINAANFQKLLQNDGIKADEVVVFDHMAQWVVQNAAEPHAVYVNLFKSIRLECIPAMILAKKVEPFFQQRGFKHLIMEEYRDRVLRFLNPVYPKRIKEGKPVRSMHGK